ncbi:flagellar assembly protein FliW [Priestia megaterium]|nr:flagellar assembly protein FliW [Priestia megaterium]
MMMKTTYHGDIDCKNKQLITFEKGLPGFLDETEFVILPLPEADVFHVLQSTKTAELAFIVAEPFQFFPDYDFKLDDASVNQLQLQSGSDAAVYVVLTMSDHIEKITANLQAPILINTKTNLGKQVILNSESYQTKHPLFQLAKN